MIGGAARRARASREPAAGSASRAAAAARGRLSGCAASSSPAPAPRSARPWSPRRSPTRSRRAGERVAGVQARGQRARRGRARPTTSCCAAPPARSSPTTRSLLTATGRRSRRTWPPSWPASRSIRSGSRSRRARPTAGADVLVCEGVGGLLVPLTPGYLVRDFARDLGLPVVVAAPPGLGTINHTLLTLEAARSAGLEVAPSCSLPGPASPSEMERSNRETIERLGACRVPDAAAARPLPSRHRWPALRMRARLAARDRAACALPNSAAAAGTASSTAASHRDCRHGLLEPPRAFDALVSSAADDRTETTSPATTTNRGQQHRAAEGVDERRAA